MAITHIAAFGSNGSKVAGTTLVVTATPGTQPAIGDLIVVSCARDDIANDPLTGDSISDGHGNTYTRLAVAGAAGTDASAANGINLIVFYCVLTVAWSGSTTVTWTHPSITARGMQIEHFAPTSGYTIALYGTPPTGNGSATPTILTAAAPLPAGDLVFGAVAIANDTTITVTGDSDTLGGSWSTITANAGTTGGTAATNAFVATQYKILTSPAVQVWNPSIVVSSSTGDTLLSFHEYPPGGPYLVGIGNQVASSTGNVTPPLPTGTTTNDVLLMVIAGRPSSNAADGVTIAGGTDGWAQHGSTSYVAVAGVDDLSVQMWWKLHDGSESDPTVSVNTVLAQAAAIDRGYSAQIAAFRNIDTVTQFDVTPVASNTGAAAATFTPTGVTTLSNGALALSLVATADDNAVNFNTSQSFVMAFGGTEYDTTTGTDHSVALGWKIITSAGAVTEPTWNQSVNGNDQWVGLSTAMRPPLASSDLASAAGSAFNASTTTSVPAPAGTASATGAAYDATVTTGTSAATDANAGTATATGTANNAATTSAVAPTAGSATGTGTANTPTLTTLSVAAAGTASAAGSAFDATATTSVPAAAGTGTATGVANTPGTSASQPASAASATGTAFAPTITAAGSAAAGTATGSGAAYDVSSAPTAAAGSAVGTSAAYNASTATSVAATAGLASAVGTANDATATSAIVAPAGSASGSGTANPAAASGAASVATGTASATSSAFDAAASTAVVANAGTAIGAGAANAPTVTVDIHAGLSVSIGVAYQPTVTTVSNGNAGTASGVGTAYGPALTVSATAGLASAAGSAYTPAASTDASAGLSLGTAAAYGAVVFTVNSSDPIAYTYLILAESATWALLARTATAVDLTCTSTLVEMETI